MFFFFFSAATFRCLNIYILFIFFFRPDKWYVVSKDRNTGTIYIGKGSNHSALFVQNAAVINFSWISGHAPASLPSNNGKSNGDGDSGGDRGGDSDENGNESGVMVCECRVRYRSELVGCDVMLSSSLMSSSSLLLLSSVDSVDDERRSEKEKKEKKSGIFVRFHEPQKAVAPGQILVLYDNDVCLGGGTIL